MSKGDLLTSDRFKRLHGISSELSLRKILYTLFNYSRSKGIAHLFDWRRLLSIVLSISAWKLYLAFNMGRRIRNLWEGEAVFRSPDESHKWIMYYLSEERDIKHSQREVEVVASPLPATITKPRAQTLQKPLLMKIDCQKGMQVDRAASNKVKESCIRERKEITKETVPDKVQGKEGQEKKNDAPVLYKPAPSATTHFVFEGTHFWAERERRDVADGRVRETITLTYWSRTSAPLDRLVLEARRIYMADNLIIKAKKVAIHRLDRTGYWKNPEYVSKRRLDTLHLPAELKQEIAKDARTFFSREERQKYADRSIPYRRGYLLYGKPGNGKSTLCRVLASEWCDTMCILDLGSPHIDDDKFLQAMASLPPRCVVLIEDIDAAFVNREAESVPSDEVEVDKKKSTKSTFGTRRSGISFSAVLNALDGVDAAESRLLCITTNHIEALDKALIRPGRIDKKFEIKNATPEQAKDLFIRWFTPRRRAPPRRPNYRQTPLLNRFQHTNSVSLLFRAT